MITEKDIEGACADNLRKAGNCPCYSEEVLEGFKAPAFFCKAFLQTAEPAGNLTVRKMVHVVTNYYGPQGENRIIRSEENREEMAATLFRLFYRTLKVGDRFLFIRNQSQTLGGENQDVLIFTFDLDFFDQITPDGEKNLTDDISLKIN